MNFSNRKQIANHSCTKRMQEDDLVIAYMGHNSLDHFYLKSGDIFQNKYGAFHHDDMIGQFFGTKIYSRISNGWIYAIEPTPELWSIGLHTRTQIVNESDSSVIISGLDIFSGCKVVESGTGSGCFTIALARAVYPHGRVYTFEYNEIRANMAKTEFERFKLDDIITVSHRDICGKYRENEAGFDEIESKSIDAVFFDLPEPWLALPYALRVLKPSRNICCYSPCIEQVMKTREALNNLGFYNISMIEVRQKLYDGRVVHMENADLGLDLDSSALQEDGEAHGTQNHDVSFNSNLPEDLNDISNDCPPFKRLKSRNHGDESASNNINNHDEKTLFTPTITSNTMNSESNTVAKENTDGIKLYRPRKMIPTRMSIARPVPTMKGHSAFLTFALCPTTSMLASRTNKMNSSVTLNVNTINSNSSNGI